MRGQRREQQHDQQQRERVDDAGDRRFAPGAEVGGRAGDGAGDRDAANKRRREVRDALRQQLRTRVVPIAGHASRPRPRRAGSRRPPAGRPSSPTAAAARSRSARNCGISKSRQPARNTAEPRTNGLDGQPEASDRSGRRAPARRSSREPAGPDVGTSRMTSATTRRRGRTLTGLQSAEPTRPWRPCAPKNSLGRLGDRQAEKVFDLRRRNEQGDAVGEADHDGTRDELDRLPEARGGQEHEDHAGHHCDHQQAREPVLGDDAGDDDDEGPGRTADLDAANHPGATRAKPPTMAV